LAEGDDGRTLCGRWTLASAPNHQRRRPSTAVQELKEKVCADGFVWCCGGTSYEELSEDENEYLDVEDDGRRSAEGERIR
jgi:hypothetical protein